MNKFIKSVIVFLFIVDALSAQIGFEEWLKKRDEDFSNYQSSLYEDWSLMQRDRYARWKGERQFDNSQTRAAAHSPAAKTWVVIIGIAEYNLNMLRLNFTKDDAYRMYAFYKSVEGGSLPDEQIMLVMDIHATRTNVLKAIEDTYSKADKDDAIIFYFAGHGTPGYFLLYDFTRDGKEDLIGVLKHEELNDAFAQSQAKYKYIIADACHSGSLAESGAQRGGGAQNSGAYQSFNDSAKGFVMMLSSMGEEKSIENDGIRQGVFSHSLINGMKGIADVNKDGIVSVIELFDYVDAEVRKATNEKQNPVLAGDYDDSLPVSVLRDKR